MDDNDDVDDDDDVVDKVAGICSSKGTWFFVRCGFLWAARDFRSFRTCMIAAGKSAVNGVDGQICCSQAIAVL